MKYNGPKRDSFFFVRELGSKYCNILVFDDLMSEAIQSPLVSRLFTEGCHLHLLQNMFRKGKINTDISQNAHYSSIP